MNRPSNDLLQNSRAEQRRLRLLEAEREQHVEELEALKVTDEQLRLLEQPFTAVKFEFCDLDGLHWTKSSLYTRQYRAPVAWQSDVFGTAPTPAATNAMLTKADLARFSPEDTIRLPKARGATRKSIYPSVLQPDSSIFSDAATTLGFAPKYRHRDGSKERSPIKGLFNRPPTIVMCEVDLNAAAAAVTAPGAARSGEPDASGYTVLGSYSSPEIHYEDMLQDNAYYSSCPPSPCPTPTKSFRYLPCQPLEV